MALSIAIIVYHETAGPYIRSGREKSGYQWELLIPGLEVLLERGREVC